MVWDKTEFSEIPEIPEIMISCQKRDFFNINIYYIMDNGPVGGPVTYMDAHVFKMTLCHGCELFGLYLTFCGTSTTNWYFWYGFNFFSYKSIENRIWPCRKIGQGQPRVIIWINLVVLEHLMMHTNFHGHQPFGSREEDFFLFLPHMGMAAILVMCPGPFEHISFPYPIEAPHEIWL